MFAYNAQSTRSLVGKNLTEGQQVGVERNDPPAGAPPGRRNRAVALLGLGALLLLGGCGSGGGSAEVTCDGARCRAVVTGTPVEVSERALSSGSMALVVGTTASRPKPATTKATTARPSTSRPRPTTRPTSRPAGDGRDEVDFVVRAVGSGWVEIEEDGVRRVPAGEVFAEDDTVVRVDAADGRTATFTWQR